MFFMNRVGNQYTDVIKQIESVLASFDFEIQSSKRKSLSFLIIVKLQNIQMFVSLELNNQFSYGFQLNVTLKIPDTLYRKPKMLYA